MVGGIWHLLLSSSIRPSEPFAPPAHLFAPARNAHRTLTAPSRRCLQMHEDAVHELRPPRRSPGNDHPTDLRPSLNHAA
ncbi:uncharacterized protein TRAVEDRAFT_58945 [Trametes versicolor FP-101664 SS1]|uniref:uncharacterized protein n=1 Tax=Trametes versicolor (strain FP-101664) TaxID=717944 RepID=UPI000462448B|nr:uncharacterized protein TRAVEDRAFT_58945 [Trametes versicolor FP-101664 SS1]EIW58942.1 hypothetical protein TRAVEDRAFT_58945 [Trametes versicolor FP-101664 SS1]